MCSVRVAATETVSSVWESGDLSVVSCAGRRLVIDRRTALLMSSVVIAFDSELVRFSGSICLLMSLISCLSLPRCAARGSVRRESPWAL